MIEPKKKRLSPQKPEDFIGWKSEDGNLEVVGIHGKYKKVITFKVICKICSPDIELFPKGYFVSTKANLKSGRKPCGCSKCNRSAQQCLVKARRKGETKGFIVHGFAEEFHGVYTKLDCECLIDGHKWNTSVHSIINLETGCPVCGGKLKLSGQEALARCSLICEKMKYKVIGFFDSYKNAKSIFRYECQEHGVQSVTYNNFVLQGTRCPVCFREKQKENSCYYGWYPERAEEQDFLYILNFNDKYIKVGRSFDLSGRIPNLKSKSKIKNIITLRLFTATHREIFQLEQGLHKKLREKGFEFIPRNWYTEETFTIDSLSILNRLLDHCKFKELSVMEEN